MPSLYSDINLQKVANPEGYAYNIAAWQSGLTNAVSAGAIPGNDDILALRVGPSLISSLESAEFGRPAALGSVIVGE